jgi:hypothetical protein
MAFKPGNENIGRLDIVENIRELNNMNGTFEVGTLFVVLAVEGSFGPEKLSIMDNYKNKINKVEPADVKKVYR